MTDDLVTGGDMNSITRAGRDRAEGAFLGAAIGDALGWPHEMRASRSGKWKALPTLRYESWTKRSGGRFQPHEERIEAGHYSDDTQLILAVARSLLRDRDNWWLVFATEELPLWTLYQRGGGGATKRSAAQWLAGRSPWDAKPEDVERFFTAGGNGVAMRVLPHCLRRAGDAEFAGLAADIVTDGVTTHGHPRALVGALAYGYGLWQAFRHRGTLGYGHLLERVHLDQAAWGGIPDIGERWPSWRDACARQPDYARSWSETVREQLDLLDRSAAALAGGAAVVDEDALEELGCFDPRVNGAGTVNAAAALFLASRHAADPIEGLKQAALAEGADTDTLASMIGGLMGAAIGAEWLSRFVRELQDHEMIRHTANAIGSLAEGGATSAPRRPVTKSALSTFVSELHGLDRRAAVTLPNGLEGEAEPWGGVISKSRSLVATSWLLRLRDGQTWFIKKLTKSANRSTAASQAMTELPLAGSETESPLLHLGFRLTVSDLAKSASFYQAILGLPVSKRTAKSVNLGGVLSIGEANNPHPFSGNITVYAEVRDLQRCLAIYRAIMPDGDCRIEERQDRTRMLCLDPQGYKVEIYQMKAEGSEG